MIAGAFLLLIGLLLIVFGADYFIAGSSLLAKRFGIPKLIIGLTIVAIGTSVPELGVNIMASMRGQGDIALGNVLGSNLSNTLLIFPIAALFAARISISANSLTQVSFAVLVSLAVLVFGLMSVDTDVRMISTAEGLVFILLLFLYWFYLYKITIVDTERLEDENLADNQLSKVKPLFLVPIITVASLAALLYGSSLVTGQAVLIARALHISELTIAATIIAIGTSLPELVTSVQAVRQKQFDLMIGNIVGSNILNTLFILGVSVLINPIAVTNEALLYLYMNSISSVLLLIGFTLFTPRVFRSWHAVIFISIYILFIIYTRSVS